MPDRPRAAGALLAAAVLTLAWPQASAQKIVCWKDNSGKIIGCGDRVPPEYQRNETQLLDSQGIVRKTQASAEAAARQKEAAARQAAQKAEEDRRTAEQRRLDSALINTYTSSHEIDQRRDRELQAIDQQLQLLTTLLNKTVEAEALARKHLDSASASAQKPPPKGEVKPAARHTEDLARVGEERQRLEARIAEKQRDREEIASRYASQKARFIELTGAPSPSPAAAAKK